MNPSAAAATDHKKDRWASGGVTPEAEMGYYNSTDDPRPRNSYWEMWAPPVFDLPLDELEVVMRDVRASREAHPNHHRLWVPGSL